MRYVQTPAGDGNARQVRQHRAHPAGQTTTDGEEGRPCKEHHPDRDGIGDPMPIYIVEFTPEELWGVRAEPGANTFYAELFEAYLQPVQEDQ